MRPRTRIAAIAALATMVAFIVQPAASGKPAPPPTAGPKNVILFIGDGMGPSILQLARLMAGGTLNVDSFQAKGTVDTTSLDGITDSAAAATAIATGVATHNGELSMWPDYITPAVPTVLERAESLGKATGLITDNDESSATPAAFASHVPDRDLDLEIVQQEASQNIEAMFSGGWGDDSILEAVSANNVSNLSELQPYLDGTTPWPSQMYGFFRNASSLAYSLDRQEEGVVGIEPTLDQLTQAGLGVLSNDPQGFFLMVEAGSLDWGGHSRDAAWVASDTAVLMQSVAVAVNFQKTHPNTLIVVTTDHETGGLQFSNKTVNLPVIAKDSATTEWMWGAIQAAGVTETSIRSTLATCAGIPVTGTGRLSAAEVMLIANNKEMGISDVLSARQKVSWGWSGTDEGDHTATPVKLFANGPWASKFAGTYANENLGKLLISAVSN